MNAGIFRALRTLVIASLALPTCSQFSAGQSAAPNAAADAGGPAPYVAEYKITTVKTLADRTTLTQEFTEVQAWDGQGRTMTSITSVPASSDEAPTTRVRVSDPGHRMSSTWNIDGKPRRMSCSPAPPASVPAGSTSDVQASGKSSQAVGLPSGLGATVSAVSGYARVLVNVNTIIEHLGTQAILGFEARGSRVTQTTPAGANGNSQPLVSSRESWQTNVNGIGLTLREVDDDPQNGKRVTELVKFSLEEPDPASFQPPEGNEVSTQEPLQASCSQPGPQ